jgi:hypothetical protein
MNEYQAIALLHHFQDFFPGRERKYFCQPVQIFRYRFFQLQASVMAEKESGIADLPSLLKQGKCLDEPVAYP